VDLAKVLHLESLHELRLFETEEFKIVREDHEVVDVKRDNAEDLALPTIDKYGVIRVTSEKPEFPELLFRLLVPGSGSLLQPIQTPLQLPNHVVLPIIGTARWWLHIDSVL
jgi:hypothetical protein